MTVPLFTIDVIRIYFESKKVASVGIFRIWNPFLEYARKEVVRMPATPLELQP